MCANRDRMRTLALVITQFQSFVNVLTKIGGDYLCVQHPVRIVVASITKRVSARPSTLETYAVES